MQSVMANPVNTASSESTRHSQDPNNGMIQLASASEQFGISAHNQVPNASSFVDADAAFAGGSAYTTNTTSLHGAPQQPNDPAPVSNVPAQLQGQAQAQNQTLALSQSQGMTNFAVNHNSAALPSSTSGTTSPGPSSAQSAINEFVIPYPSPPSENLGGTKKKRKSSGGSKAHQLPMFLTKTYHMIEKCDSEIATWSENGDNFVVKNVEKFASSILPQYFKHSNFSSFARQLNFYGFRKLKAEPILTADYDARTASYVRFYHEKFQKDKPELLVHIKRATKSDVQSKDDVDSMRAEIQHLNDVIAGMQNEFDRRFADMYLDLNNRYNSLYQNMEAMNQQIRLSHGAAATGGGQQLQGQAQGQAQVQNQLLQVQNGQAFHTPAAGGPAKKKNGTDMLQTLSQACLTLKSPALPPVHPSSSKEKPELENFSLK